MTAVTGATSDFEDADAVAEILADVPSFVQLDQQGGLTIPGLYWCVESSRILEIDVARGEALAVEAIKYCRRHSNSAALIFAIAEMIRSRKLSGVEIGFLTRVAQCAQAGALN